MPTNQFWVRSAVGAATSLFLLAACSEAPVDTGGKTADAAAGAGDDAEPGEEVPANVTGDNGESGEGTGSDPGPEPGAEGSEGEPTGEGTEGTELPEGTEGAEGPEGAAGDDGGVREEGGEGPEGAPAPAPIADLRADTNRDGTVSFDGPGDDAGEDEWNHLHGAIFLANLDDDEGACPKSLSLSDTKLPQCHDAADEVINGGSDYLDLSPLAVAPWPEAPADTVARLAVEPQGRVRLFYGPKGAETVFDPDAQTLTAADLRAGVALWVEGTDIVRDAAAWDGFVRLTLTITDAAGEVGTDTVVMRVAPVLTSHHLLAAESVFAQHIKGWPDSDDFVLDIRDAAQAAGLKFDGLSEQLALGNDGYDQWTQDIFETAFMSRPGPGGAQVIMRVVYRTAGMRDPKPNHPLRAAGRLVFTKYRGPGVAGVQEFDIQHDPDMDTLNSFGNWETIPPYTLDGAAYPMGRLAVGSIPSYHPDPKFYEMVASQGFQPPVLLDTSWLLVGHIDEYLSFIKAATPRGWKLLLNDPRLAKQMLEDATSAGHGTVPMFVGQYVWDLESQFDQTEYAAEASIDEVLADPDIMGQSATAAVAIDAQWAVLAEATGLAEEEVVPIPFLHEPVSGYSLAYQPGTVNGLYVSDGIFAAPETHGPEIGGVDIFKAQLEDALAAEGIQVHWVENWNLYHREAGEVHCGTNVFRAVPSVKWWETDTATWGQP